MNIPFLLAGTVLVAASPFHQNTFAQLKPEGTGSPWTVTIDDRVFRSPLPSEGRSQSIEDYYYAVGPLSGIRPELLQHRIEGSERVHVFHLPGDLKSLGLGSQLGDRRSSISTLLQMKHGQVLNSRLFPLYETSVSYVNPLGSEGQAKEQEIISFITEEVLMSELQKLTSLPSLSQPTRSYNNMSATHVAVSYLKEELDRMGFVTCLQEYSYQSLPQHNVIAYIPGTSSSRAAVVIGAHFDSRPYEGAAPGAVDNGSGVAALVAIARAFGQSSVRPKRPIYFVAFGTEEMGLYGSQAFASALKSETLPTDCQIPAPPQSFLQKSHGGEDTVPQHQAIIMDEIAWKSSALDSDTVNLETYDSSIEVMDNLAEASRDYNGQNLTVVHSSYPFGSDHMSFLNQGFHSALTIQGDDESYPMYHSSSDTIAQVNWPLITKITKMNAAGLFRLTEL